MTRVHHGYRAQSAMSGTISSVHHRRAEPKRKPSYKVVLEEVKGQKKLNTLVSQATYTDLAVTLEDS